MLVRPGRLLPSVIVGALVTGALALGAGTAVASSPITGTLGADECRDPETGATKTVVAGLLEKTATGSCRAVQETTLPSAGTPTSTIDEEEQAGEDQQTDADAQAAANRARQQAAQARQQRIAEQRAAQQRAAQQRAAEQRAQQAAAQREAALAAQRAAQAQAAATRNSNLLTPAPGAPGGLAAGVPALGFGTLDPSLLLAPQGSPLRTLTGVDEGSPVTTASDVQAMAFDDLPGGLGTPAVTGVLILSTFAAFALRHRVLRRARLAADADSESEADTAESPTREPVG